MAVTPGCLAAEYVVTLVHGTWADTDGWVASGSFLRRELERSLGDVTFREFSWAGRNTHAARTEGGASLARFIRAGHAQHPDARHFLIAHSHGGNVALYAMRDPAARSAISGIVTLATPFIYARRRELHRYADVIAWLILGVAALLAFVLLDALGVRYVAAAWLLGSVFLMVTMTPALTTWLVEMGGVEQAEIVPAYQPPAVDRSMLLVLCARGDEARRWLRAWEVVAKGPFVIGCILLAVVEGAFRSNLPAVLDGFTRSTLQRRLEEIHLFGFDGWTLAVGGVVLCLVWGLVLLLSSSVMRWPGYWREPLRANVLAEIGTDSVPRAADGISHTAHTFDVPPDTWFGRLTRGRLRHTFISNHPAVVSAIGDWIRDGVRPADGAGR